jgi:hypothetical protein
MGRVRFAGAVVRRDHVRLNVALTRRLDAPWVVKTESYLGGRWNAHFLVARGPEDVAAIPDLPDLVCEAYRDLGMQGSLRQRRTVPSDPSSRADGRADAPPQAAPSGRPESPAD